MVLQVRKLLRGGKGFLQGHSDWWQTFHCHLLYLPPPLTIFHSTARYFEASLFDWYHPLYSRSTRKKPQLCDSPMPFWQQSGLLYMRGWPWVLDIASLTLHFPMPSSIISSVLVLNSHKYTHSFCGLNSVIAQLEAKILWESRKWSRYIYKELYCISWFCAMVTNELNSLAGYILKLYFMPIL